MKTLMLLTGLLGLCGPAHARNVALDFFGSDIIPSAPSFEAAVYRNACMKAKGWDVQTVAGEQGLLQDDVTSANPDLLAPAMKKVAGEDHFHDIQGQNEDEVLASVEKSASTSADAIGKGDNFLFEIDAHGLSPNCAHGTPSGDPNECDQFVAVRLKGAKSQVKVSMKKLAPIIGRLRAKVAARGGHFAVESRSCYGGASLKEFAAQGVCAHAFSAPDATLGMCGGYATPAEEAAELPGEASAAADTTGALHCQGVSKEQMFGGSQPYYPAKKEDGKHCMLKSAELAHQAGFVSPGKISFAKSLSVARNSDHTGNQALGTDGPFWVLGGLSWLGSASRLGGDNHGVLTEVTCFKNGTDYLAHFAGQVDEISDKLTGGAGKCSLKGEIVKFGDRYKGRFDGYFKTLREMRQLLDEEKTGAFLRPKVPGVDAKLTRYLDLCDAEIPDSPLATQMRAMRRSDAVGNLSADLRGKGKQETAALKKLQAAGFSEDDIAATRAAMDELHHKIVDQKAKVDKAVKAEGAPLERMLYDTLKDSPAYKKCVASDEKLKQAQQDCEAMQLAL